MKLYVYADCYITVILIMLAVSSVMAKNRSFVYIGSIDSFLRFEKD